MPFVEWSKDFEIGVPSIDEEHKVLIGQLNTFYDAIQMNIAPKMLLGTMEALVFYVSTHFTHEEEYMMATNYPDFLEHKIEHDILRSRVLEMHAKALENATDELSNELLAFLKGWVNGHILYCDKTLGRYLKDRNVS